MEDNIAELNKKIDELVRLNHDLQESRDALAQQLQEGRETSERINIFAHIADEERRKAQLLLASIGEGVFVLSVDRHVLVMNHAAEQILGYRAVEFAGTYFDVLLKFRAAGNYLIDANFFKEVIKEKKRKSFSHIVVLGKNRKPIPIAGVIAPLVSADKGDLEGFVITFRDAREEQALEEARINFVSIASHQLRTPLTSMRWFSEMLLGGDAGKITVTQKKFITRIYEGTDRMINLINLLLKIARVEAGRLKIEPVSINLKSTIRGVIISLKATMKTKSQKIEITTDPSPFPRIPLDQEVIWQVFQNLISNASRYSPPKSTIVISIVKKGDEAECAIADHGIGIPKAQQNRIFEKFFRADNAVAFLPEGSGLGLSLVRTLVEDWGGKIWFDSTPQGTTFYFTLPLKGMEPKAGEVTLTV